MSIKSQDFFSWIQDSTADQLTELVTRAKTGLRFDDRLDQFFPHTIVPGTGQAPVSIFCNPVRSIVALHADDLVKHANLFDTDDDKLVWCIQDMVFVSDTDTTEKLCREVDERNFLNYLRVNEMPKTISLLTLGYEGECELLKIVVAKCFKNIPPDLQGQSALNRNWKTYLNVVFESTPEDQLADIVNEHLLKTNRFFTVTNPIRVEFNLDVSFTIVRS